MEKITGRMSIMNVTKESFGSLNNKPVYAYTLVNNNGMEVQALNYGCIITKIMTPDKAGNYENIVLGYDRLEDYLNHNFFFGAVCGRVAGRIKDGSFELDGKSFFLAKNDNDNHLHGGIKGFDKVIWNAETFESEDVAGVEFSYISVAGEEGYPGNLTMKVTYTLNNDNELTIHYNGKADQKTLLNVTNHSYFNLSGNLKRDVLNHSLTIKSDKFLELNDQLIPTGKFLDVKNTPFDFNEERQINTGVSSQHPQNILAGNGYDHPFVLTANQNHEIVLAERESGRTITVETDRPSVVIYSGNSLEETGEVRGVPLRKHLGICMETQGLPDAIHHPEFPSIILDKDEDYSSITKFRFGIMAE